MTDYPTSITDTVHSPDSNTVLRQCHVTSQDTSVLTDPVLSPIQVYPHVQDASALTDALSNQLSISAVLSDSSAMTDPVAAVRRTFLSFVDTIATTDALSNVANFRVSIVDNVGITVVVLFGAEAYVGWIANFETGAHALWDDWNFSSMACDDQGHAYGTNDQGIYALDGPTDDNLEIRASLLFGRLDFGNEHHKRIPEVAFGMSTSGVFYVRVIQDDGQSFIYRATPAKTNLKTHVVHPGLGIRSRYLQFEIVNEAGQPFALETVEFFPVILTKHR